MPFLAAQQITAIQLVANQAALDNIANHNNVANNNHVGAAVTVLGGLAAARA